MNHIDGSRVRRHEPVMITETVACLKPGPDKCILDCTVGAGGHSRALLEAGVGRIIGIDRDMDALSVASSTLSPWSRQVELIHANYLDFESILDKRGIPSVDGVVADLGMSSMQIDGEGRGFSFRRDEPLDMRMDRSRGPTAADLLRSVSESELADIIYRYGEERYSRRIARVIVDQQSRQPIATTNELAAVVRRAVPRRGKTRIDPSTRTFQALRIWVNDELAGLDSFLWAVCNRLAAGARFVVLAFHSLEDRVAKTVFRKLSRERGEDEVLVRLLTKRPMRPVPDEVHRNRRARSAKLRAVERVPA